MLAQLTALLGSLGYLEGQKAGQEGHPNSFHQQQLNVTRTAVLLSRTQLETLISFLRALAEPTAADKDNKG